MLLTDSDIITEADLEAVDPEVPAAATALGITVSGPGSILEATARDCTLELQSRWQMYSGYLMSPGITANHIAAVMNMYSTSVSRPRFRPNQVVALDPDPAKRGFFYWMLYSALYNFYRAAAHRIASNDRYILKLQMWQADRDKAQDQLDALGIPIVLSPLPAPAATREFNPGTWGTANLAVTNDPAGGATKQMDVAITWTGAAYQSPLIPANAESAPSPRATFTWLPGTGISSITIDISSLNPPNLLPNVGTSEGVYTPMQAAGWNVYIGLNGDPPPMYLQNPTPIPIATKTLTLTDPFLASGPTAGVGQFADYNYAFQRVMSRA